LFVITMMRLQKRWRLIGILMLLVFIVVPLNACSHGTTVYGIPAPNFNLDDLVGTVWDMNLMLSANQRIEQYRKGNATILVEDVAGKPLAAKVTVEMVKHDFLFGCNLLNLNNCGSTQLNRNYSDAFLKLFNYGTLPFFWDGYETKQGYTLEETLRVSATWARDHGITTQGHPLIWAKSVPSWVNQVPDEVGRMQQARVSDTVNKFCGLIDYWDVVNEVTSASKEDNPLGRWIAINTPDKVTASALGWARVGCPQARLVINDYNTGDDYLALLKGVVRQQSLNAIGIQSHMHTGIWRLNYVWNICDRFGQLGIPLQFTEVTVLSEPLANAPNAMGNSHAGKTTSEGEALQADYVPALYTLLFSHPSVEAITWWDLSDLNAWQGAPAGLLRADMSPKPVYNRLVKLIRGDWWTRETVYSDDKGVAKWRGFYGDYRLTIQSGDQIITMDFHLTKGTDNTVRVRFPLESSKDNRSPHLSIE
jgi:endo-1,4-beta-xylanase